MTTRKIVTIDEHLCNGCGDCTTACAEGALQLVNGKARLVKEVFCDGFGDCIGECPTGALKIEEREAPAFDYDATKTHVGQELGGAAVRRMEEAHGAHGRGEHPARAAGQPAAASGGGPAQVVPSDLAQWPVQIHLVSPEAPCFKGKELVVLSTCSPIASADIHWRFLRGRAVVVGCPKLDRTEGYVEKLAAVLQEPTIPRVTVVRMEVPCCGGLTRIVQDAARQSGRRDLAGEEATIGVNGDWLGTRQT